jgi:DNA-binding protein H-NS
MELSNLSIADLRGLQENVKQELKKREQQEVADAREKILAIAKSVGVSVSELVSGNIRTKSGPVAVQYRNPSDGSQEWTGRGRQPKWIKAWIAAGKPLTEIKVSH